MRKLLIAFVASIFCLNSTYGQDLKDIFLELSTHGGISKENRQIMIDNYLQNKRGLEFGVGKSKYYLLSYNPKNGYLSYSGAYEGATVLTYWNMSNGAKLIGVESSSCGGACDSNISFIYKGTLFNTTLDLNNVLPTITFADFMDVEQMKKDGIDINKEMNLFFSKALLYNLPSAGKNIIVSSQYQELDMDDRLKKYDLGRELELLWNDGTFVKKKN